MFKKLVFAGLMGLDGKVTQAEDGNRARRVPAGKTPSSRIAGRLTMLYL